MKILKRIIIPTLMCILMTGAFTACHSHNPEWRIDKEEHWKECECGEISEKGEHTFELDICTVCGAEIKKEDGIITDMTVFNSYGDWIHQIYFDEDENPAFEYTAEYDYDESGNVTVARIYEGGALYQSAEYAYDDEGFTYKKYETEHMQDGSRYVIEYNETGDPVCYYEYDADGKLYETRRSEYLTDENGELTGERVYINDVLTNEMKYLSGSDGEEEYYYISEQTEYLDDGSRFVEVYDESGDVVREISYDAEGKQLYDYELEYFYNDDGYESSVEKRENGVLKEEIIFEYNEDGDILSEKVYNGNVLVKESIYTAGENFFYVSKIIIYNEDGTVTTEEYDEMGEAIE